MLLPDLHAITIPACHCRTCVLLLYLCAVAVPCQHCSFMPMPVLLPHPLANPPYRCHYTNAATPPLSPHHLPMLMLLIHTNAASSLCLLTDDPSFVPFSLQCQPLVLRHSPFCLPLPHNALIGHRSSSEWQKSYFTTMIPGMRSQLTLQKGRSFSTNTSIYVNGLAVPAHPPALMMAMLISGFTMTHKTRNIARSSINATNPLPGIFSM